MVEPLLSLTGIWKAATPLHRVKAVYISHSANAFGKCMYPTIPFPEQNEPGMVTSLGEE